jgi:AraC-like DNA-binding protein/quercetin dioxygenase-like cupin family protein
MGVKKKQASDESALSRALPEILTIGTMMFDPLWAGARHGSAACELMHIIRGTVNLELSRGVFRAGPGDTLLLPPRTPHRDVFDLSRGLEVFFCAFDWAAAPLFFRRVGWPGPLALAASARVEARLIFDHLRVDLAEGAPLDQQVGRARLHLLLLLVYRDAWRRARPPCDEGDAGVGVRKRRKLMEQAKAYLEEHCAECVQLEDVAAALRVSPYYLSHVFSEQSEFTLFSYLTQLRMEKARRLLREGVLNVSEVARAAGWRDANYFAKVFRKYAGCSPRQYAVRAAGR